MKYQAFTNDSMTMMYEGVRGALAADDALKRQNLETRFRVRETPEWKNYAADLEAEMLKHGMFFEVIDWYASVKPPRGSGSATLLSAEGPSGTCPQRASAFAQRGCLSMLLGASLRL
jgi:hypothetical protein